jgi:hypothetical protein
MSGYGFTYEVTMSNPRIHTSKFVALSIFLMGFFFFYE